MTNSKGYRRGTRYLFAKRFGKKGVEPLSTFLHVYKIGQYVDIKCNGAFHKGMPHKSYHGRTGKVFNVTQHALGVIVNKRVKGRILPKKINIRVEHVKHSDCRKDFLERLHRNEKLKKEAKEKNIKICLKRQPVQPRVGHLVKTKNTPLEVLEPIPYEFLA
ncbi:unnamed protein product [Gordionus sp. m RMFG-2023]|uniref:large ribosomal subunit protein eL21-like n=1 Tax=Gordionus sp. m RMFG-2023 TaxID=3053472 RepID=UPI0030E16EF1